jgi:hypothetical protein
MKDVSSPFIVFNPCIRSKGLGLVSLAETLAGTPWKKTGKREKSGLPSEPAMAQGEISLSSMGPERFIY